MTTKHLLVDLSSHGFGHFAQTSVVLNALHQLAPELKITVRGTLPEALIQERLEAPVTYLHHALDVGMKMHDAVAVDAAASFAYYDNFHRDYQSQVAAEVNALQTLKPDLLLANVPYVSLSAAHQLGIPSIAFCSLNWADIFESYCGQFSGAAQIIREIRAAYNSARYFLMATPHMPMPNFQNALAIPPIAYTGSNRADRLKEWVGNAQAKFILVSLGGIPTQINTAQWPSLENVYWIVGEGVKSTRQDVISQRDIDLPFIDLVTSCDAIMTKTGYGTLVEAVAGQTPVICIERGSWPEEPPLFEWVRREGYLQILSMRDFELGSFAKELTEALDTNWLKPPPKCNGSWVAANIISDHLSA